MWSWRSARTARATVLPTVVSNSAARRLSSSWVPASILTLVLCMQISIHAEVVAITGCSTWAGLRRASLGNDRVTERPLCVGRRRASCRFLLGPEPVRLMSDMRDPDPALWVLVRAAVRRGSAMGAVESAAMTRPSLRCRAVGTRG